MPLLRDAIDEPQALGESSVTSKTRFIKIFHPGYYEPDEEQYDPNGDVLISLPALDDGGIHHDTAHTACAILAANRWDGYFSRDPEGRGKIDRPPDGILRDKSYFFCLPSTSTSPGSNEHPYPVIARFSDWRFPHDDLPPLWKRLQKHMEDVGAGSQLVDNSRCCLSNYADGIEQAHLVPSSQSIWWSINAMSQYCQMRLSSTNPINAPANFLTLRSDIHKVFDERHFCFVPKIEGADEGEVGERQRSTGVPRLAGHVFNPTPGGQLPRLFHNRCLHDLPSVVSVECLFARFAWTIFSPTIFRDFLYASTKPRRIKTWDPGSRKFVIENADPERCNRIFTNARARSESPKKRSRGDGRGNNEAEASETYLDELSSGEDTSGDDDSWPSRPSGSDTTDDDDGKWERGRTKKRKFDDSDDGLTRQTITTPRNLHRPEF
ncbi:hypothetical protein FALBO_16621 [Fusarium albosuccineum]|uniref:HNH nuclease domain-containing protein n=1 Tax=Fusarium albosuccineum TaxID=1237068 RepID=A0A8H4KI16_9HYPO|nr:hypothetical protein FALBO_16621 [Fusarium albosuccineum]